ncbi:hypothetical protein K2173_025702 [Erythroxylum novogranatense]|uniref:Uncharacterized protein n=1 Tax=Erythroxylum novogranatense TaxID=1862640 RepID=A0AAV8SBJ8_9ROSI|nr:hypothetical protein K2173_025702 [Erythroxylum novogranatense]
MKRPMPWSDDDGNDSSGDESSSSHSDSATDRSADKAESKERKSGGKSGRRKAVDFEALKRHGYKGGLSVLNVPPPKDKVVPDWSWSTGKEQGRTGEVEESYEERQRTRAALKDGEQLANVQTSKEKKSLSFSQKEKRKREFGQASRGKSYVEEEKRLLRDSGIYSGFDT